MAKILFNDELFNISEAALNAASERIMRVLSSVMNGTGATINFGGTTYNIDSTKLSTATNSFVSHLGTVSGSGMKVSVGGVEYSIDSSKMSNAVSQIHAVLSGLQSGDSSLVMNEYGFYFDVPYSLTGTEEDGTTAVMSMTFFEDGSYKSLLTANGEILIDELGDCEYELNKITAFSIDGGPEVVITVINNGTQLDMDGLVLTLEADIGGGDSGIYDDEFPIEWNTMEVVGNSSFVWGDIPFVKISNITPSKSDLLKLTLVIKMNGQNIVQQAEGDTNLSCAVIFRLGDKAVICMSISEDIINEFAFLANAETGLYLVDIYTMTGMNADCRLELAQSSNATTITWDGNTEGLVSSNDGCYYKVSDLILTDEQVKNSVIEMSTGEIITIKDFWDNVVISENIIACELFIVTRINNSNLYDLIFPEAGIYFIKIDNNFLASMTFPS